MYISGTHKHDEESSWKSKFGDYIADARIPLSGHYSPAGDSLGLTTTPRYQQALQMYLLYHPKNVVGHSLGSAIAKRISDDYMTGVGGEARYYGAPFSPFTKFRKHETSFRHFGDPVSALDYNATQTLYKGNPHSFEGH